MACHFGEKKRRGEATVVVFLWLPRLQRTRVGLWLFWKFKKREESWRKKGVGELFHFSFFSHREFTKHKGGLFLLLYLQEGTNREGLTKVRLRNQR